MAHQKSVGPSRAGDVFHYRWAARRCLRLIDPQFGLDHITVECSQRPDLPGELVIDVAEYSTMEGESRMEHFQLKHGTVNPTVALTLSDLKKTFAGFAARFRAQGAEAKETGAKSPDIFFTVVTNRPVCSKLKEGVAQIARGSGAATGRFVRDFQKVTQIENAQLTDFCRRLSFLDREGDYRVQKRMLQQEMSEYLAGFIEGNDAALLENLVSDMVMPVSESGRSDGVIRRDDVLLKLGPDPKFNLFPAPPKFEKLTDPIRRQQQEEILRQVLSDPAPLIVHAAGGVGKSIVARQLAQSLPNQGRAVIYDCFGAGSYLSMSGPRHHAREALVQIANELAARGLCHLLVPRYGLGETDFYRDFLSRVATAVEKLREIHPEALLVLLIDAADNAAMAAKEESGREFCFVHGLLREQALPEGCRLVLFARSERVEMLQSGPHVKKLPLRSFSETETLAHLRRRHPGASEADARELHRLSDGNPRVQANALAGGGGTVAEILTKLGPHTMTLDDQIAGQLETAMTQLKKYHSGTTNAQVDAICQGLANLPPLIPITVLAEAAKVSVDAVKSFVADFGFGRPLWSSDNNIQFRDEPSETWFRRRFKANAQQIKDYVARIEPLAEGSGYVARALPHMLLLSGEHEKLVELALSDRYLPTGNEIEARSVRVYRLQFAFKSALCLGRFSAAVRLAFRAGEEVAGNERETEMLGENLDLVALLEEPNRVRQMACQQRFGGGWLGCETIYSASLLSSFTDFEGDAHAFLRSAQGWLHRYFEEGEKQRAKKTERGMMDRGEVLSDEHVAEYWWAHYNLSGAEGLVDCVARATPQDLVLRVMRVIVRRLIDANRFEEIATIAQAGQKLPYLILVVAEQLIAVGKLPPRHGAKETLQLLADPTKRLKEPDEPRFEKTFPSSLVSFLEGCAGLGLDASTILRALEVSVPAVEQVLLHTDYQEGGRRLFLRRVALRAVLANQPEPTIKDLFPPAEKQATTSRQDDDEKARDHMIKTLLPWHFLRTRLIVGKTRVGHLDLGSLRKRTGDGESWRYDRLNHLPDELNAVHFEVLAWHAEAARNDLDLFARLALGADAPKFWLPERLQAARIAFRLPHLLPLRDVLEQSCRAALTVVGTDGPEERSSSYLELARAVLAENKGAAAVYFARALEAVSKFGDEMVARWNAVVAMANRAAAGGEVSSELVYRFIRCAEMIGETVAREKYWDRDEALQTAVRMNPAAAFAALSRWRDRDVGWFDEQVNAVAIATVRENKAPPLATWCLSGFQGCNHSRYFAEACLRAESDTRRRGQLFERILRDFELAGAAQGLRDQWHTLIDELKLPKERLEELALPRRPESVRADRAVNTREWRAAEERKWRKFFLGVDLFQAGEIDRILKSAKSGARDSERLWEALLDRVPRGREPEALRLVAQSSEFDFYDCGYVMAYVHRNWSGKVAVERECPIFLTAVGQRFAGSFASCSIRAWLNRANSPASDSPHIRDGMVAGLSESSDLIGAGELFGFISNSAELLASDDARSLLEYALDRFEPHMDLATQADGPFHEGLVPEPNVSMAMAGLVWCALGSPFCETRWEAAHCVRRWAELDCLPEVDGLIGWLRRGNAGAFAGAGLPFYELHAKLYLLIAFLRVAVDDAKRLARHAQVFRDIALSGPPHFLIQATAARIALPIEQSSVGSFSVEDFGRLRDVGRSGVEPRILRGFSPRVDSPRHARGEVDLSLKFHFGMDFGDYWLRQLGDVFHLPQKQVEELVREVVVGRLGVPSSEEFTADPRQSQWERRDRDTWFHKTSYPRADNHRFYVSYHGMHVVAAQLVTELPVVVNDHGSWKENEWDEWQRRHGLTRDDGRWLSDRRDPSPSLRRPWTHQNTDEHWLWSVRAEDFFEILARECPMQGGICIDGRWTDCASDRSETIQISSALVEPSTSASLANALRHIRSPMDFRLPSYGDERAEESAMPPFNLVGWIRNPHGDDPRLDSFDPYAKSINYPPAEIGDTFATRMGLVVDSEKRAWTKSATGGLVAQTEIWSERNEADRRSREEPYRCGQRLSCDIALLRELCTATGRHIIFSVEIGRSWNRSSKTGFDEYMPDSHKIFVFSADGLLRDTTKTHRLG